MLCCYLCSSLSLLSLCLSLSFSTTTPLFSLILEPQVLKREKQETFRYIQKESERDEGMHHCLVWQLLGIRLKGTTEGSAYGPVHNWGQASCHPGPLYKAVSKEGPKTPATLVIDCSLSYSMASPRPYFTLLPLSVYYLCIVTIITLPTCTNYLNYLD